MDISLFYKEQGSGFPLVLLHGNGEDHTYFSRQIPHFAQKYRVLAVETRGHGSSPRGTAPFCIAQFAEDLKEFLDEHAIEQAIILGFSDGANIAMRFAIRYPSMVKALVLDGGNLNTCGVRKCYQIPIEIGYNIANMFATYSKEALAHAEMLGLMVNDPNIAPEELSVICCPTLVMAGNRDMIKTEHTRIIAAAIPDAELAILEGDHFIAAKCSAAFNARIDQFLNEHSL